MGKLKGKEVLFKESSYAKEFKVTRNEWVAKFTKADLIVFASIMMF